MANLLVSKQPARGKTAFKAWLEENKFTVGAKYASEIKIGFPITFTIDGSNEVFKASVYAVDPKINIETRTITVRALYPNRNEEIKSCRYAGVSLQMSEVDNAIAIPTEALIPEMEGEKVFIFKSGKAQSVKVNTGLRTASQIQILEGLQFGDTLITSGIMQLRQDLPVVLDTVIFNK
jgi:membrane fusion protein (multidrug efflux system)